MKIYRITLRNETLEDHWTFDGIPSKEAFGEAILDHKHRADEGWNFLYAELIGAIPEILDKIKGKHLAGYYSNVGHMQFSITQHKVWKTMNEKKTIDETLDDETSDGETPDGETPDGEILDGEILDKVKASIAEIDDKVLNIIEMWEKTADIYKNLFECTAADLNRARTELDNQARSQVKKIAILQLLVVILVGTIIVLLVLLS